MTDKPISLVIDDFRKNLASVVNNSGLPLCISELIIKELYDEARELSKQQLLMDKEQYKNQSIEDNDE